MKPQHREDIEFIKSDLIPEMVYNRCFCDPGSREFVEFHSATVESIDSPNRCGFSELYVVEAVVNFSGEPQTFHVIVKLPPSGDQVTGVDELFQNEELFYSKMAIRFGQNHFPKCYAADLGRYGRPVIVLENLASKGYRAAEQRLDEDHLKLCLELIGKIHGKGLRLRTERFSEFREFYAKFQDSRLKLEAKKGSFKTMHLRALENLKSQPNVDLEDIGRIEEKIGDDPYETARNLASEMNDISTICHGDFCGNNILFRYENGKPVDAKVIDWQSISYCSVGIDLGIIFLGNVGSRNRIAKVDDYLKIYLENLRSEYPNLSEARLKEEFVSKLLYAYILGLVEKYSNDRKTSEKSLDEDEELVGILQDLIALGSFD